MHRSLLAGFPMALVLAVGPLPGQEEEAASLRARTAAALAPIAGELEVAGLRKPVEVLRDTWGVPHIYARTEHDLFFAQGYVHAQDRFWQMICPDHFVPPTSNIIQGKLGLRDDTVCVDVNQACAGFVLGLIQSFMLLDQPAFRKMVLVNGDVLSRRTSPKDRNIFPLIGDAATITVLERDPVDETIHAEVRMDAQGPTLLSCPLGAFVNLPVRRRQ